MLVLSLFPGIGLLDMAFEEEGFCVVRGPDLLWGGDIRRFHPPAGKFDGVIGGPPCQLWSQMRHIQPLAGMKHGNMIPLFERVVREASPAWFIMENVRDAPLPRIDAYHNHAQLLRDVWVGGDTMRLRRISFGTRNGRRLEVEQLALHTTEPDVSALASGGSRIPVALGGSDKPKKQYGNSGPRTALGRGSTAGHYPAEAAGPPRRLPARRADDASRQVQDGRQRCPAPDGPGHCQGREEGAHIMTTASVTPVTDELELPCQCGEACGRTVTLRWINGRTFGVVEGTARAGHARHVFATFQLGRVDLMRLAQWAGRRTEQ